MSDVFLLISIMMVLVKHQYILLMVQKSGGHQLRLVVYPIIYRVLYIPGGCLGCLPSRICFPGHDGSHPGRCIYQNV